MTDPCQDAEDTFLDRITMVVHSCKEICFSKHPETSPIDCEELCPDYFSCLMSVHRTEQQQTTVTVVPSGEKITTRHDILLIVSLSVVMSILVALAFALTVHTLHRKGGQSKIDRKTDYDISNSEDQTETERRFSSTCNMSLLPPEEQADVSCQQHYSAIDLNQMDNTNSDLIERIPDENEPRSIPSETVNDFLPQNGPATNITAESRCPYSDESPLNVVQVDVNPLPCISTGTQYDFQEIHLQSNSGSQNSKRSHPSMEPLSLAIPVEESHVESTSISPQLYLTGPNADEIDGPRNHILYCDS